MRKPCIDCGRPSGGHAAIRASISVSFAGMPTGNAPTTPATTVVVPLRSVRLHGAAGCAGGGNGLATLGRQTTSSQAIRSPNFVPHTVRATLQGRTENDGGVYRGGLGHFPLEDSAGKY